jgi:transcriptional regulator with XRE-family HTH domain
MTRYTASEEQRQLRLLLRKIRMEAGLRQADMARLLKQSQSFVSKYESGERRIDFLELRQICRALKLSLEEFVRRFERQTSDAREAVPKTAEALLGKRQKR